MTGTFQSDTGGTSIPLLSGNVSDVGRIISNVENGKKELIDVKLIHYIDKGWVVEEDDE